jgi:PAS domain S-box-containing protein
MKIDAAELPVFLVAVNFHCKVIEWNPKAAEITGLARSDALEKDVGDCLDLITNPTEEGSYAKEIKSVIIDVLHSEALLSHEFLASRAYGDRGHNMLLNISALRDESGSVLGAMVVGQDIKKHKQSERNQMADGDEIRMLFENATSLIIGTDSSGLINVWNPQMTEVTGFSKEDCLGKDFVQVRINSRV